MRKPSAKLRQDGEHTRDLLIEAAGQLAGELGWANVQAKHVCERAGVNCASVNYWFGSRDALYDAVVAKIPDALINESAFRAMVDNPDREAGFEAFVDFLLGNMMRETQWPIRVWAREITGHPSDAFLRLARERGATRIGGLRRFLGDYLGVPPADPRVAVAILSMVAMMFLMMTVSPQLKGILFAGAMDDSAALMAAVKAHVRRSIDALRDEIAREKTRD